MSSKWAIYGVLVGILMCACVRLSAGENAVKDSYKYYGPNGLWEKWTPEQRFGRDSWIHWSWGNQKIFREFSRLTAQSPVPMTFDFLRMLDTNKRDTRFKDLGLINEPNCVKGEPDKYGFRFDKWLGDPEGYYPGLPGYETGVDFPKTPQGSEHYGMPTGILGLRLFKNTSEVYKTRDEAKWENGTLKAKDYFENPANIEPPYVVGLTCAFCHIAFNPLNPPADVNKPRWENLASNIGNQYLKEGELFLGKGRIVMGGLNRGPNYAQDPYDTQGLLGRDFLNQYATTQQPGTSETSRISYDFINNPNTVNPIFQLGNRPTFTEVNSSGKAVRVLHILKDGADSVGARWAMMRVPVNIGCQGNYWVTRLFNPVTGKHQRPVSIAEMLAFLPDSEKRKLAEEYGLDFSEIGEARKMELATRFGNDFGQDWNEAYYRSIPIIKFLASYERFRLEAAPGGKAYLSDDKEKLLRGAKIFARKCAICHSSKPLPADADTKEKKVAHLIKAVTAEPFPDAFLENNYLSDDVRYPATYIGTNMARALATNAIDGDVWAEFSSRDYKALKPLPQWKSTLVLGGESYNIDFTPPGGGRGYYRTPSLVGMWATAPYLHNNSLGKYIDDPTLKGRMEMFQDGVERLLLLKQRENKIKVTDADSYLIPDFQNVFSQITEEILLNEVKKLKGKAEDAILERLKDELRDVRKNVLSSILANGENREALKGLLDKAVSAKFAELRSLFKPEQEDALNHLKMIEMSAAGMIEMLAFKVPKGSPVNLYLNISTSKLPYAVIAFARNRSNPKALIQALLDLSDCPDLIEDKGHGFGVDFKDPITGIAEPEEMTDDDKKALIEYLKRL